MISINVDKIDLNMDMRKGIINIDLDINIYVNIDIIGINIWDKKNYQWTFPYTLLA